MQTTGGLAFSGGFGLVPPPAAPAGPGPTTSNFIGLAGFIYTNKSFSGGTGTNYAPAFSEDGTKLYYNNSSAITQYTLSSAFDISTATSSGKSFSHSTNGYGFDFSTDGTKLFIASRSTGTMRQYSLSTPWDISTASYVKQSGSLGAGTLQDIAMASDGSAIFYSLGGVVKKLVLATAWDVAGSSVSATSFNVGGAYAIGLAVTRDGLKLLTAIYTGHSIREYTLSSAFNISSPTLVTTYNPIAGARPGGDTYSIYLGKQDTRLLNSGSEGSTSYLFSDGT